MDKLPRCESCGMPMRSPEEFGGKESNNKYCCYCTDEQGRLRSYESVLDGMTAFTVKMQGLDPGQARLAAKEHMATMPAWKDRNT
ncbi:AraC family transcriptional regulator [bacterium]|nr:AraC family transcriptional regulator [bacterium]